MRIAFWLLQDSIRHWSAWVAGLHYVKNCLEALATLPDGEVPTIVAFVPDSLKDVLLDEAGFRDATWLEIVVVDEKLLADHSRNAQLQKLVDAHGCDILFPAISPPSVAFSGRSIGWITDYQHKHYPEFFAADDLDYRDRMFAFLTGICDRIVCSSAAVREDFEACYPQAKGAAHVLRFCTQPPPSALAVAPDEALRALQIEGPYAYLPYQFWQHKNHEVVLKAWLALKQDGLNYTLVCTGATEDSRTPEHFPRLQSFIADNGLSEHIHILGLVPREIQWQLYRGAKMILQPSLFEGWSTSVEESRALGKPVFLSDINVHREQLDDSGIFFDPNDHSALARLLQMHWERLPAGFDREAEETALQSNHARLQAFGRSLCDLFQQVSESEKANVAASVLPLYLFMQKHADERLTVIQGLLEQQKKSA